MLPQFMLMLLDVAGDVIAKQVLIGKHNYAIRITVDGPVPQTLMFGTAQVLRKHAVLFFRLEHDSNKHGVDCVMLCYAAFSGSVPLAFAYPALIAGNLYEALHKVLKG